MRPQTLVQQTLSWFPATIRYRGDAYALDGRVKVTLRPSELRVDAIVQGTRPYRVALRRSGHRLDMACECPYFEDGALCKHIWALIRSVEQHSFLSTPPLRSGGPAALRALLPAAAPLRRADATRAAAPASAAMAAAPAAPAPARKDEQRARMTPWEQSLEQVLESSRDLAPRRAAPRAGITRLRYDLCAPARADGQLRVLVEWRLPPRGGAEEWAPIEPEDAIVMAGVDAAHKAALSALVSCAEDAYEWPPERDGLSSIVIPVVVPLLCRTGACRLRLANEAPAPLTWDPGPPWEIGLAVSPAEDGGWELGGELVRAGARVPLEAPSLLTRGLVVIDGRAAELRDGHAFAWIALLREQGKIRIPAGGEDTLLERLLAVPDLPPLTLPEALRLEEVREAPRPLLRVAPAEAAQEPSGAEDPLAPSRRGARLRAAVSFQYGDLYADEGEAGDRLLDAPRRRAYLRDREAEEQCAERLEALGLRRVTGEDGEASWQCAAAALPDAVGALVPAGWRVEAEGRRVRSGADAKLSVTTGVDWLDLQGYFDFGGIAAPARDVIAALRRGERTIALGDGSVGVLPAAWLERYGLLARLGDAPAGGEGEEAAVRFPRSRAPLLSTALEEHPEITVDQRFARLREALRPEARIQPAPAPRPFRGELRPYQQEGLGWLLDLERREVGGCLADDMGLGKTVQVLSLLAGRANRLGRGGQKRPSLVVAPRSLMFNWRAEAARFAPRLRVLEHTGPERPPPGDHFDEHDLILTTYALLRADIEAFAERRFDYVILDEAQAIKNAASASAEAARRLSAEHRLALSGTPVENHMGELWSLMEFLNPGLFGPIVAPGGKARALDERTRDVLVRAVRPFLLRRTKRQVAPELPDRTEETLLCEMGRQQRGFYDRLRRHYQETLLAEVRVSGVKKSQMQILEALLRLRQAACHPALVDPARRRAESVKLDTALERARELAEEGHKALIFSQFTGLLAHLRARLDAEGIAYEYLDGATSGREERVRRFQEDDECRLFLISLRAGGTGLNLTAADYVLLLDPWWNPAVEAQAIDRAHRIGQRRPVIAYRLICQGTIEEKIVALQETKRALAASILDGDEGMLRALTAEDLEMLLS